MKISVSLSLSVGLIRLTGILFSFLAGTGLLAQSFPEVGELRLQSGLAKVIREGEFQLYHGKGQGHIQEDREFYYRVPLHGNEEIHLGKDSEAKIILLKNKVQITLTPQSFIHLREIRENKVQIFLFHGEALFHIQPGGGVNFSVQSQNALAQANGTVFRFKVDGGITTLKTQEGEVLFSSLEYSGITIPVQAGIESKVQNQSPPSALVDSFTSEMDETITLIEKTLESITEPEIDEQNVKITIIFN